MDEPQGGASFLEAALHRYPHVPESSTMDHLEGSVPRGRLQQDGVSSDLANVGEEYSVGTNLN